MRNKCCGLLAGFCALFACNAAALVVTHTGDSGSGSLRAAIAEAAAGDTIEFQIQKDDPGYDSGRDAFTITLTTGEIVIDKDLAVAGPSAANIVISGNNATRIFHIASGNVDISNLSFSNGRMQGADGAYGGTGPVPPASPGRGGAILNEGTLTCTRCTFRDNNAIGGSGASGNSSTPGGDALGGAILNENSLSLIACTLTNNVARSGKGGVGQGGELGPYNFESGIAQGGAIYNGPTAALSVTNCTIAENAAYTPDLVYPGGVVDTRPSAAAGGGIAAFGSLALVHSTVANNAAAGGSHTTPFNSSSATRSSFGGGVFAGQDAVVSMRDTITAENQIVAEPAAFSSGRAAGPDVKGTITSEGHNLLGRSDGCSGFTVDDQQGGTTDATRLDPKLGALGEYGGPTETLPLLDGSPAIDAADNAPPAEDQRGFPRRGQPDIGAFEHQQPEAPPSPSPSPTATVTPSPTVPPSPTASPSPTLSPSPTASPSATASPRPVVLGNIATRARVRTGDNALIAGFIITGTEPKTGLIRVVGPSLKMTGALADPTIEAYDGDGTLIATNDNWKEAATSQQVRDSGLAPTDDLEPALWAVMNPGAYTTVVSDTNETSGIAVVEVYDLDRQANSEFANISTRAAVETEQNVMIGGFFVVGSDARRVAIRALGPSLSVPGALADPTVELYDANGASLAENDNWRSDQEAEINATGIPPSRDAESAIVRTLVPGGYTAIVRGASDTTGVALVEVYALQ